MVNLAILSKQKIQEIIITKSCRRILIDSYDKKHVW